jgi:hypothetical protein
MKEIIKPDQAIPVRPRIVRLLGHDHIAAIYFQQMVFYDEHCKKDGEGYFAKSIATVENDTALTREQQDRVRRKLVNLGWITVEQSSLGIRYKVFGIDKQNVA